MRKKKSYGRPNLGRLLKNKYLWGGLCLLIAAVVAFVVVPQIYGNQEATTVVVRAAQDIPAYTQITAEMLETVEVGAYNLPGNVVKEAKDAVGQFAAVELLDGDTLTTAKLEAKPGDSLMTEAIGDGLYMVTVTLPSNASALATQLQPGDYVAVATYSDRAAEDVQWEITTDENGEQTVAPKDAEEDFGVTMHPELANLQVFAVSDSAGVDATVSASVPKTVTFLTNKAQAEMLIRAEYEASIHLIWKGRGALDSSARDTVSDAASKNATVAAGPAGWKGRGSIEQ